MAILTDDMKRVIREQRLGFYATVCEDGSPNLSPKGTTYVLDDDHLFFADVRSPQTVANIRRGSLVEVNVVDPLVRKGYRFKGPAAIHEPGTSRFAEGVERLRETGSTLADRVRAIVVVEVREARAVVSPAYDDGTVTEGEVVRIFRERYASLHREPGTPPAGGARSGRPVSAAATAADARRPSRRDPAAADAGRVGLLRGRCHPLRRPAAPRSDDARDVRRSRRRAADRGPVARRRRAAAPGRERLGAARGRHDRARHPRVDPAGRRRRRPAAAVTLAAHRRRSGRHPRAPCPP